MKTKLLLVSLLLISSVALSQVVAGQADDFEDGTTQDWIIGNPGQAVSPPANVSTGGPNGAGDSYLTYTSTPPESGGAGSKMIIFNSMAQWSGDFNAAGILAVTFDVRVTTTDLNLRIAFQGPNGKRICTTNPVNVTAGSGWQSVSIPVTADQFTAVGGPGSVTIEQALAAVSTMRILSSTVPTWLGADVVVSTLDLDNITAVDALGVDEFGLQNEFEISPNPGTSRLNIKLSGNLDNANVIVYDVLGKKVYSKTLDAMVSSIDVSRWNTGIFLVRVSTDTKTFTKRFVKQ
ncbi:T9SS type A sorting domain-containing protein [Psychroserpens algicola]|uniref:T9SS type A sorting domain-containing protein n=1 Tax=Psychroserpens algicola TaxID=1719034 RepID=A0ABT0H6K7_9FLAO|nr:T9SS type A sorting domain-containing protein [Psychroserpens algicola]MCK8479440.1 T9SS type A sorting domain-containing protein [Psychroserpens algicola]